MDNTNLHSLTFKEKQQVISLGNPIVKFDSLIAFASMYFIGSNQRVDLLTDQLVLVTFIKDLLIFSLNDKNQLIATVPNDILYLNPNIDLNSNKALILAFENPLAKMPIKVTNIIVMANSNLFSNETSFIIVNKTNTVFSKVITYTSPNTIGSSYNINNITDLIILNDTYIAALIDNTIAIFDIRQGYNTQCNNVIVLSNKWNTGLYIINMSNGKVKEPQRSMPYKQRIRLAKSLKDDNKHCLIVSSGITKVIQVFKGSSYKSISELIEDDKVIRIDKIDNKERYLFTMSDYFNVYDTTKQKNVQKIASLFTASYCLSESHLIYYSTPVFYSVKIDLEKENQLLI